MIGIPRPVVVLLASGLATLALVACTASTTARTEATRGSGSTSTPPTTTTSSSVSTSAPLVADPARYHVGSIGASNPVRSDTSTVSFRTPSLNVRCTMISAENVTCEVVEHTFAAATRPGDCMLNWLGSAVTVGAVGARLGVCAGNPVVLDNSTVLRMATGSRSAVCPARAPRPRSCAPSAATASP